MQPTRLAVAPRPGAHDTIRFSHDFDFPSSWDDFMSKDHRPCFTVMTRDEAPKMTETDGPELSDDQWVNIVVDGPELTDDLVRSAIARHLNVSPDAIELQVE